MGGLEGTKKTKRGNTITDCPLASNGNSKGKVEVSKAPTLEEDGRSTKKDKLNHPSMTKKKEVTNMGSSGDMKDIGCGNTANDLPLDNDLTKVDVSQQPPLAIIGEVSGCATTT